MKGKNFVTGSVSAGAHASGDLSNADNWQIRSPRSTRLIMGFFACMSFIQPFATSATARENVGSTSQPLTIKNVRNWTANGNVIPVCWETTGYDREKKIIREAVAGTWEWFANINFTGWDACPTSGSVKHVRIRVATQDDSNAGAGGSARLGMDAMSSADDNNPGVNVSFSANGTADKSRVEYIGVHEFGHVLGFVHEQDTPGNVEGPAYCKSSGNEANATTLTAYDRDSIMNYCNRDGNGKGNLTDIDIVGVQAVYGTRIPSIASRNSCASTAIDQTASVAWGWNDGSNQTSFALFPSAKTKFLGRAAVSVREGGWGDEIKWFSGDFNGDGLTDIGGAWNDGGQVTLTVRQSTGTGFSAAHWAIKTGGWMDSAVWLPGDFNADGHTDVAGVWNDGGSVSIAMFLSDGKKFNHQTPQWSVRDGGWGDTVKWFAGDFNGDDRTDIGAAWNNAGATTLTVRQSTGSRFTHVHWSDNAGNWSDSSAFVAGDFNGDGRTDVARLWNDIGQNSTSVSLSIGSRFLEPASWSVRDGGWILGAAVKWFPGDFNGDGRTDIGVAWNNDQLNTLTVRQSTGSAFTPAHWAIKAGGWRNSATWCTGQFKANGALQTHADTGSVYGTSELAIDKSALAAKGEAIANEDPLAVALRDQEPEVSGRRGFDIGMAAAQGQTLPGPGKQRIHDALNPAEQAGFRKAVSFSLERNRNAEFAATGAAIAQQDAIVAEARSGESDIFYWLGFDIASGIFGDPALGARGNTATGSGSLAIRDALSAAGQRGFNASVQLHLSRDYTP